MNNSIRLVRCPKCRKILPELPNLPVYKCGGCGATLQAKKLKNAISRNGSRYEPIVLSSQSKKSDHPAIESSPETPVDTNFSNEHARSTKPNFHQDEKLSRETNESGVRDERERQLERDAGPRKIESLDQSSEKSHDRTSDEIFSSCDSLLEYESSSAEISISRKKYEEGNLQKLNVIKSVNEHRKVDDSKYLSRENDRMRPNAFPDQIAEYSEKRETTDKTSSFTVKDRYIAEASLLAAEKYSIAGENSRRHIEKSIGAEKREEIIAARAPLIRSVVFPPLSPDDISLKESPEIGPRFHRVTSEEILDTSPINPRVPTASLSSDDTSVKESPEIGPTFHRISSDEMLNNLPINPRVPIAPLSPNDIYLKGSPEIVPSFHRESSEEMPDTIPINPRVPIAPLSPYDIYLDGSPEVGPNFHHVSTEEMLDTLPMNPRFPISSMFKSPKRTYYADESEISYDGTEELSANVSQPYSRKVKGTGTTDSNRSRLPSGSRVKNKQSEQEWRRHELPKSSKHSRPIRTSMAEANNEPKSRDSYMPRSSQLFHGNESPASSARNVLMQNGEFRQPDIVSGSDPDKVELLRMVYALEDKINRTQMPTSVSGERLPSRDLREEIRASGYYDDPPTGENPNADFKYYGHMGNHSTGVGWGNHPRSSRLVFSGEASQCRRHIDCRCSHCYHQGMHISPKLSSYCIHCQHPAQPRLDYDNSYPSYSPSPQHYSSSQYSREIQADHQKNDHERKTLYLKDKHQGMKTHIRPVSHGAPIINCYNCSELLQLPANFLLFRKRCHRLRCSSCKTILKFSILKKSHLVPYVIKIQVPLPSKMDNYGKIVGSTTLASTSHANNPQDAGPVSISDDLVPSFSRNDSTESGPSVASSSHIMNGTKRLTVLEVFGMNKSPRDSIEAAGPSSSTPPWVKPSTEIEEPPATSGSPLHRLMGYESARQVLFAKFKDV